MNIKYKLYLSIGLLFSITESTTFANATCEGYSVAQMEQYCDDVMHTIFECFFNDQDKTLFSKIIIDIIEVLKAKRNLIDKSLHQKYDTIITLLETNKHSSDFKVWSKIFPAPELKAILPIKTQNFLDTIPLVKKIRTLVLRLNNNK